MHGCIMFAERQAYFEFHVWTWAGHLLQLTCRLLAVKYRRFEVGSSVSQRKLHGLCETGSAGGLERAYVCRQSWFHGLRKAAFTTQQMRAGRAQSRNAHMCTMKGKIGHMH